MNETNKSFWILVGKIVALIAIVGALVSVIAFYYDLRSEVKILSERIKNIDDRTGYSKTSINQKLDSLTNYFNSKLSILADTLFVNRRIADLNIAEEDYRRMSERFNTAINQFNNISSDYQRKIKQLTSGIDLYIIPTAAAKEKEYLKGYVIISKESEQVMLEGKDALRQRVFLTFDDSTKSIFSVLAREKTIKVKLLFSQQTNKIIF